MFAVVQSWGNSARTRWYSSMAASSRPWRSNFSASLRVRVRLMATLVLRAEWRPGARAHLGEHGVGPERPAVDRRVSMLRHGGKMVRRGVPLVPVESVARVGQVEL